eukprot:1097735-Rhodomonas_salina.1
MAAEGRPQPPPPPPAPLPSGLASPSPSLQHPHLFATLAVYAQRGEWGDTCGRGAAAGGVAIARRADSDGELDGVGEGGGEERVGSSHGCPSVVG